MHQPSLLLAGACSAGIILVVLVLANTAPGRVLRTAANSNAGKDSPFPANTTCSRCSHVPSLPAAVPDVRQSQPYSSGAASLQTVLSYREADGWKGMPMERLESSPERGTLRESILTIARQYGMDAEMQTNMTLHSCEVAISKKKPVIITCQAWEGTGTTPSPAEDRWEDGHYMVVIRLDADSVFFEDPAMPGSRGIIPRQELLSCWHDYIRDPPFSSSSPLISHTELFAGNITSASYQAYVYVD